MMARMIVLMLVAGLAFSTGCASVKMTAELNDMDLSPGRVNVAHVNGQASGLYFLSVPIFTGDTSDPESWVPAFMRDTATLREVGGMVTRQAKIEGATAVTDLTSSRSSLWLPIFPVPLFFWQSVQISGNGVR